MAVIIISGGSGLIGNALCRLFSLQGHSIIILTRDRSQKGPHGPGNCAYANWNIWEGWIDQGVIEQADYIIHIAGAGIAEKRWTNNRKKEIIESRVRGSATLINALHKTPNQVKAVISASAIGWYGPDPTVPNPHPFTEENIAHNDFLGQTCFHWEESMAPVQEMGKRLVVLRTGMVLTTAGGLLAAFTKSLRMGLAPILGTGRQQLSWIHIDDLCRMYLQAIQNENMRGVYNAVAPEIINSRSFVLQLAKKMKGKMYLPIHVPSFALKMLLGEMSIEVLKSTSVSGLKIRNTGFQFAYPTLDAALNELIK